MVFAARVLVGLGWLLLLNRAIAPPDRELWRADPRVSDASPFSAAGTLTFHPTRHPPISRRNCWCAHAYSNTTLETSHTCCRAFRKRGRLAWTSTTDCWCVARIPPGRNGRACTKSCIGRATTASFASRASSATGSRAKTQPPRRAAFACYRATPVATLRATAAASNATTPSRARLPPPGPAPPGCRRSESRRRRASPTRGWTFTCATAPTASPESRQSPRWCGPRRTRFSSGMTWPTLACRETAFRAERHTRSLRTATMYQDSTTRADPRSARVTTCPA